MDLDDSFFSISTTITINTSINLAWTKMFLEFDNIIKKHYYHLKTLLKVVNHIKAVNKISIGLKYIFLINSYIPTWELPMTGSHFQPWQEIYCS